jgi:hypothetical protein
MEGPSETPVSGKYNRGSAITEIYGFWEANPLFGIVLGPGFDV